MRRGNGQGTLTKRTPGGCWVARWYDAKGKRRTKSTRTTDYRAASRILAKLTGDTALRREGVIDGAADAFRAADAVPLGEHVAAYIEHCRRAGRAGKSIDEKSRVLPQVVVGAGASRLSELTADALEKHLWAL